MRIWRMKLILAIVIISALSSSAKDYGGIDFPNGDISFADRVVSFKNAEGVESRYANPNSALGPPDYDSEEDMGYVSLGNGKNICEAELILEFVDNTLVDIPGDDLWIFEIGPAVEATDVYISDDGENWISLGVVRGSTRGVDISSYTSPGQTFRFVKLCDYPDGQTSDSPYGGPDIDAVGAIGTIAITPATPLTGVWDLTGVWNCDDGGKYYLRQLGNTLWWYGERDPNDPSWSNVAKGYISGNSIHLEWADVPKGDYLLNGTLTLHIVSDNELQATEKTGIFGGSIWVR